MSEELKNLARIGSLHEEAPAESETSALIRSGRARFIDAQNTTLSYESRFDLAYNSAHALALAALRRRGYRSDNRYIVFQCLPHTVELSSPLWRVLSEAHRRRSIAEYEGGLQIDLALLDGMIRATAAILERLDDEDEMASDT